MPTQKFASSTTAMAGSTAHQLYPKSMTVALEEDPQTGDTMLPLPLDLCERLDWRLDDELEWEQTKDGFMLKNKTQLERRERSVLNNI